MRPMTATVGDLPVGVGWAFEVAWGGLRATVDVSGGAVIIRDRDDHDVTAEFPELAALADGIDDVLLDGEIVGADGRPVSDTEGPPVFLISDVLRLYGVDLVDRPFTERRETLERLAAAHDAWTLPPAFDDATATLAAAQRHGLRGVVAKRLDSRYRPGETTSEWVLCYLPPQPKEG